MDLEKSFNLSKLEIRKVKVDGLYPSVSVTHLWQNTKKRPDARDKLPLLREREHASQSQGKCRFVPAASVCL
jgi:hypothetical protein